MYNYTLKYRTFDQLLADASVDLISITMENMIEPQQMIKIAKRCNYELGLRIMRTKEQMVEVEHGRAKLPVDFFYLNYALLCDTHEMTQIMPHGTHTEERTLITPYKVAPLNDDQPCIAPVVNCGTRPCGCGEDTRCNCNQTEPCPTDNSGAPQCPVTTGCVKPRVVMKCDGTCTEIVQIAPTGVTTTYRRILPVHMLENPQEIDCGCPNLYIKTDASAWIRDGFIFTTFQHGKLYLNYEGMMEDDQGNLLVPDHDLLNEFYEYALKQRILESLIMNDIPTAVQKIQLIEARYKVARVNAMSLVNTPNFAEMKSVWAMNRRAQYAKYYDMFKNFPWYVPYIPNNQYLGGNI